MMRDTFVFYNSFYTSALHLPKKERGEFLEVIAEYSLTGKLQEMPEGIVRAMFESCKVNMDKQLTNYKNGAKPKRNRSETEAKPKRTRSETEAKPKRKANYKEKEKEKEKERGESPTPFFKNYMDVLDYLKTRGEANYNISVELGDIIVKVSKYGKAYNSDTMEDLDYVTETTFLTYLMNNPKEIK